MQIDLKRKTVYTALEYDGRQYKQKVIGFLLPKKIYGRQYAVIKDPGVPNYEPYGYNVIDVKSGGAVVRNVPTRQKAIELAVKKLRKHGKDVCNDVINKFIEKTKGIQ